MASTSALSTWPKELAGIGGQTFDVNDAGLQRKIGSKARGSLPLPRRREHQTRLLPPNGEVEVCRRLCWRRPRTRITSSTPAVRGCEGVIRRGDCFGEPSFLCRRLPAGLGAWLFPAFDAKPSDLIAFCSSSQSLYEPHRAASSRAPAQQLAAVSCGPTGITITATRPVSRLPRLGVRRWVNTRCQRAAVLHLLAHLEVVVRRRPQPRGWWGDCRTPALPWPGAATAPRSRALTPGR